MNNEDWKLVIALANNRMNASEAARQMFMHRNTVTYRIQSIKKKTGLDPQNFFDLYKLATAANVILKGE